MPRRLLIIIGIALSVVIGPGVWLAQGRWSGIGVVAAVPNASGLRVGARVDYRGIEVGTLERMTLADSMVVLHLRVTRTDVPLRNTNRVAVRVLGLLGDRAVEIVRGPGSGRVWKDGDTLTAMLLDTAAVRRESEARALVEAAVATFVTPDSLDTLRVPRRVPTQ